jgi:uncharacterized repeat protein (TIGR03803 family)
VYPSGLVEASDGDLYGTTEVGPTDQLGGSVFRITKDGEFNALHTFIRATDGSSPLTPPVQAADGHLYGMSCGRSEDDTQVYRVSLGGAFAIVHVFDRATFGWCQSGDVLLAGADGNLYGTRSSSGVSPRGVAFRVTPAGVRTVLHEFTSAGPLTFGSDGNLYGTGGHLVGSVHREVAYRLGLDGALTVLHEFVRATEGRGVVSLVQGLDGKLYGTTHYSGNDFDPGRLFSMTRDGVVQVLHVFPVGTRDVSALHAGRDGAVYGTTAEENSSGRWGQVFRVASTGAMSTVHAFSSSPQPSSPTSALVEAPDGMFYGVTGSGGAADGGTVFRMDRDGQVVVLHQFTGGADGSGPAGPLVRAGDGRFYGVTIWGGAHQTGTVFMITAEGALSVLHAFDTPSEGAYPTSIIQASDGSFYGTTAAGFNEDSPTCCATVFRMTPDGAVQVLHRFSTSGTVTLIEGRDGHFYGTARLHQELGTVFRMTRAGTVTTLHSFAGGGQGAYPVSRLVQGSDDHLYGTTIGTWSGLGTVFRLTLSGSLTTVYTFPGRDDWERGLSGYVPGLIEGSDQRLYGALPGRWWPLGPEPDILFAITTGGVATVLHTFTGWADGRSPSELIQASDGKLYGTAALGGAGGSGLVFRLDVRVPFGSTARLTQSTTRDGRVRLKWVPVPGATSYTIKRGLFRGRHDTLMAGVNGATFVDTDVDRGLRYYYTVTAVNAFGESLASYEVSVTAGRGTATDFTGDGRSDAVVYRPATGDWYVKPTDDSPSRVFRYGAGGDVPLVGDFDGDGRTDLAVWRPSTAEWHFRYSSTEYATPRVFVWGAGGDIPLAADFDGDLQTDLTIYRPSTGEWHIRVSSTGYQGAIVYRWGAGGDTPLTGDFDADGRTDLTVYRPSTGQWFIAYSSLAYRGSASTYWGLSDDVPLAGDFDGDGKTEIAVYRPSTGQWFSAYSSRGYVQSESSRWGASGDQPLVGDFDGDGQTELTIYRPSSGQWFFAYSSLGYIGSASLAWGTTGDLALPQTVGR